jgi:beta-xylosidase
MVVVKDNGRFYYTAFNSAAIYSTADPYGGNWSKVTDINHYQDPGMLVDSDGKVFMYSGCSNNGAIKAVELDNQTWKEIGKPVDAVTPDYINRGFEVGGDNNEMLSETPWVEGAFMNKIHNKYYLQYAVPGTQFKSYADGLFVGDSPLGPFTFQAHSPMSSRPVGFAAGAGE